MDSPRILRVVVASPSDVQPERKEVSSVVDTLNKDHGPDYNVRLEVFRWEIDTGPGLDPNGPQALIDRKLRIDDCDLLVVLFWTKFGTPVADAGSGTEHEFMTAYKAWKEKGRPQIHAYFKQKAFPPDDPDRLREASLVVDFKNRISGEGAKYETFKTTGEFRKKLNSALVDFMRSHAAAPAAPSAAQAAASERPRTGQAAAPPAPARSIDYSTLTIEDILEATKEVEPFSSRPAAPLEVFSLAFFGDDLLAAGSEEKILLFDRRKPEEGLKSLEHHDFVYSVAFSPDGEWLASGAQDGSVRVHSRREMHVRWPPKFHADAVYSVAFSPDGELLASGGYDGWVQIWSAQNGSRRQRVQPGGRVTSVAFSPTASLLAVGDLDNVVWVWDYGAEAARPEHLGEHTSSVESVAFSPNGHLVASAGLDKRVRLWDVATRTELWTASEPVPQHGYLVRSVVFSPNGEVVASASWDETVCLWSAEEGSLLCQLPTDDFEANWHSDWIWSVAFSEDGTVLASAGSDGKIILLAVEEPVPQKRPLLAAR